MDLTPFLDNERVADVLRAVRSNDEEWIADTMRRAREEPRLERVCDEIDRLRGPNEGKKGGQPNRLMDDTSRGVSGPGQGGKPGEENKPTEDG